MGFCKPAFGRPSAGRPSVGARFARFARRPSAGARPGLIVGPCLLLDPCLPLGPCLPFAKSPSREANSPRAPIGAWRLLPASRPWTHPPKRVVGRPARGLGGWAMPGQWPLSKKQSCPKPHTTLTELQVTRYADNGPRDDCLRGEPCRTVYFYGQLHLLCQVDHPSPPQRTDTSYGCS